MNTYDTIVIGGGQAGLAAGYYLQQHGRSFVILDAGERVGDCWRNRWDSLELFTAAKYNALPGLAFPAPDSHYPDKDEMADYLEEYARHFDLPVRLRTRVQKLSRQNDHYVVQAEGQQFTARNVIVATGTYQTPHIPDWADQLDPSIQQIHSGKYQNPEQVADGDVLVVGAGSSGTQIALDFVPGRRVWLAGNYTGYIPPFFLGIDVFGLLIRTVFNFSVDTIPGRKITGKMKTQGAPVVDIRESDVIKAGIERLPRVAGVRDGKVLLEDGKIVDPDVVIWATGFRHNDHHWIDLPIFDEDGMPRHYRGVVESEPGLYFVGLICQYRGKSHLICGVSADAEYVVDKLAARSPDIIRAAETASAPASEPHIA